MFDVLYQYLAERMPLTEAQFAAVQSLFLPKHLKKGELLLREGEVAKYGAFVAKGCLRSYVIDNKGKEHVVQFAPETWWLTDINSIVNKVPTLYFMDAVEPSEVLLLDAQGQHRLIEAIPGFQASFHLGRQTHSTVKDHRIIASLSATAEERYQHFLHTYPSIAQRVPQHMLASYLGIAPETLSRIRKRWSSKK
jgi:CRP-like cAMP-binding protein